MVTTGTAAAAAAVAPTAVALGALARHVAILTALEAPHVRHGARVRVASRACARTRTVVATAILSPLLLCPCCRCGRHAVLRLVLLERTGLHRTCRDCLGCRDARVTGHVSLRPL